MMMYDAALFTAAVMASTGLTASTAFNDTVGLVTRRLQGGTPPVVGCMYPAAGNYNPNATIDSGACAPVQVQAGLATLPLSTSNTLHLLTRVSPTGISTPCGRSYDGNAWEGVQPTVWQFFCANGSNTCQVNIPAVNGDSYYLSQHQSPEPSSTTQAISRFLLHATFGPQQTEVESFLGNSSSVSAAMQAWVSQQITMPASLHRAYFRSRVNARTRVNGYNGQNPVASHSSPCQDGARWNSFAFSKDDETKTLTVVTNSTGGADLIVDGILRTQMAALDLTSAGPGPTYVICRVRTYLGGKVVVGRGSGLKGCRAYRFMSEHVSGPAQFANPAIVLPANTNALVFGSGANLTRMSHQTLNNGDSYLLSSATSACAVPTRPGAIFALHEGRYYSFDSRMALVANTLASPATTIAPSGPAMSATCPTAPKTFLNRHTCVRRPGCSAAKYSSANITLNATTIRTFYTTAGKLVLALDGLSPTDDPCRSRYSRWQRTTGSCMQDSPFNAASRSGITQAIRANTDCRNIDANDLRVNDNLNLTRCKPSNNVNLRDLTLAMVPGACPAPRRQPYVGASITVDGSCWTNIHHDKYSVFDWSFVETMPPTAWQVTASVASHTFDPSSLQALVDANQTTYDISTDSYLTHTAGERWVRLSRQVYAFRSDHYSRLRRGAQLASYLTLLPYLGRVGDVVDFAGLHPSVKTPALAMLFGSTVGIPVFDGSEACGSPGEVANDPTLGDKLPMFVSLDFRNGPGTDLTRADAQPINERVTKQIAWYGLAVTAPDQLRQRMAWALAQLFALGDDPNVANGDTKTTEAWVTFYDIFVRNGLGNYRQLLKEVAYSPLMGAWLTFKGSKSCASQGLPCRNYPDENFAREIMELFSIGLVKLNPDGTRKTDTSGTNIPTYDNHDIVTFARLWTGFRNQEMRSNVEYRHYLGNPNNLNFIDPMDIDAGAHDRLPKMDLDDQWLGDQRPLCSALPPQAFLRKGATYVYRGYKMPASPRQPTGEHWEFQDHNIGSTPVHSTSSLFQQLCAPDTSGACQFPSVVTLATNLPCDSSECLLDTVRVIKVVSGTETVYYEYDHIDCVRFAFYDNPKMIASGSSSGQQVMCADPTTAAAGSSCCASATYIPTPALTHGGSSAHRSGPMAACSGDCDRDSHCQTGLRCFQRNAYETVPGCATGGSGDIRGYDYCHDPARSSNSNPTYAEARCQYAREHVNFNTAQARCAQVTNQYANQYQPAYQGNSTPARMYVCAGCDQVGPQTCEYANEWMWQNRSCLIRVEVDEAGYINIVHGLATDRTNPHVAVGSKNVFRVPWAGQSFPNPANNCTGSGCQFSPARNTCLCNTTLTTTSVFLDSINMPTAAQVISRLRVGAPPVDMFDTGTYSLLPSSTQDVQAWTKQGSLASLDTIFRVVDNDRVLWLSNQISVVTAGNNATFRNPTMHMSLGSPEKVDMEHEVDSLIDHLAYHPNTPLFISHKLILRFTTSNPSPRYLQVVAQAFRTGRYNGHGSGMYGDLGATINAVLLDREARSDALQADPTHGSLREPIIKVMHMLRSMEYTPTSDKEIDLSSMGRIQQTPFGMPSVFNFYQPDYSPPGIGQLYSPEAQIVTPESIIHYLNGMQGIIYQGVSSCSVGGTNHDQNINGFGYHYKGNPEFSRGLCHNIEDPHCTRGPIYLACSDDDVNNDGVLAFAPRNPANASATIDELDTLLTGGRLNSVIKGYIYGKYRANTADAVAANSSHTLSFARGRGIDLGTGIMRNMCAADHHRHSAACCMDRGGRSRNPPPGWFSRCDPRSRFRDEVWFTHGRRQVGCSISATHLESEVRCNAMGGRLCTVEEVEARCAASIQGRQRCFSDNVMLWTGSNCSVTHHYTQGLEQAQRLIMSSLEYQVTTASPHKPGRRAPITMTQSQNRPYKAVVVVFLRGGADSWNMLVPKSSCGARDMYADYAAIRSVVALSQDSLLSITVPAGTQPCSTFGMHPALGNFRMLYNQGDLAFIANLGLLRGTMGALGSHGIQTQELFRAHGSKGVLGRLIAQVEQQYAANAYAFEYGQMVATDTKRPKYLSTGGIKKLDNFRLYSPEYINITSRESKNIFGEMFGGLLEYSLRTSEATGALLDAGGTAEQNLSTTFPATKIGNQFKLVAKVINSARVLGSERDAFFTHLGSFDTHSSVDGMAGLLTELDGAVEAFTSEMKTKNIWNSVTVVTISEFGRTLKSNGRGTDHAWGGHSMVMGGAVNGSRIHGRYPTDLTRWPVQSRGRVEPTTPWEGLWYPIARWMGVTDGSMSAVLPNIGSWSLSAGTLIHPSSMFSGFVDAGSPPPPPTPAPTPSNSCSADVNRDSQVDTLDILIILSRFGDSYSRTDLDSSGTTDVNDVLLMLGAYGTAGC